MQSALRRVLKKRYTRVEKLENTKHWNVFRVFKGSMSYIAKAIVASINANNEHSDVPRANKAFETEVAILHLLPATWGKSYIESFVDGPFRIIITTDIDVIPWPDGPVPLKTYKAIVKQLKWLHKHGIAHRDMEQKNVLLGNLGNPTIIDFEKSTLSGTSTDFAEDFKLLNSWAKSQTIRKTRKKQRK